MSNLNLNVAGDVHIHFHKGVKASNPTLGVIELENDDPESVLLDCFVLDPDFDGGDEDTCDDSKTYVLYALPGEKACTMHLLEALERMQEYGGCDRVSVLPTNGMPMAFQSDRIVAAGKSRYLAGPIIVFHAPFGELFNISRDNAHMASRILEELTVTLCRGETHIPAYAL